MSKKVQKGTLKEVLIRVRKYPLSLLFILFFATVFVLSSLLVPILIGDGIDYIVGKGNVNFAKLKYTFLSIVALVGIASVSQWLLSYFNNRLSLRVVEDLRTEAFCKLSKLPLSYLDTHPLGDTVSRIISDAELFADGLLLGFTQFFTGALTIIGTIVFMFIASWGIALVVVCITPLSLLVARYISKHTHNFFIKQAERRGEETAFVEEMITSMKTVQAFSMEEENQAEFDKIEEELKKASFDATFYSSLVNPSTRFVNNIVYAIVALIGGLSIANGSFTVGGLTKFLSYANQYTKPFNEISGVITEFQNALVCASRIFALLDEKEEDFEGNGVIENATEVKMDEVRFSYTPEKPLIEGLCLQANRGEKIAIVGPTGCGKTTIINLLMRFYDTTGGGIYLDGKEIKSLTRKSLRKQYGLVLQDTWLKYGTVKDNIRLGNPNATDEEVINAAKSAHAHGFIKRLEKGYDTMLGEEGGLSQGQKQLLRRLLISCQ